MDKNDLILRAALELFVTDGFHGTPTSKIAARAGVSNGTLFHYYPTKDELIIALYNAVKADLAEYLGAQLSAGDTLEVKLKKTFIHSLRWALDNREKFYYVQQLHFSPYLARIPEEVIREQTRFHFQLIEEAVRSGLIQDLPPDLIFTLISSQVNGLYQYLSTGNFSAARQKQLIEKGYDIVWKMIKA
jgi:AcrR family transcriptional regulator